MRRRGGFTLLETIVTTMLLAVVVLLLFNVYPAAALSVRRSHDRLQADTLAQSLLAEKEAVPFSALTEGTTNETAVVAEDTVFDRQVEITAPTGHPDLLKAIRVTVRWTWPRGEESVTHELYRVNLEK